MFIGYIYLVTTDLLNRTTLYWKRGQISWGVTRVNVSAKTCLVGKVPKVLRKDNKKPQENNITVTIKVLTGLSYYEHATVFPLSTASIFCPPSVIQCSRWVNLDTSMNQFKDSRLVKSRLHIAFESQFAAQCDL